ncbi:MAG: hypothetical protein ABJA79_06305 [Parafilimonas sp.]
MNTKTKKKLPVDKKPNGFRYKIQSESERREVKWLIRQRHFDSIKDYEDFITKIETGKLKPVN